MSKKTKKRHHKAKHVPPQLRSNLTAWMNLNNYTNSDLAAKIGGGVSPQSISKWLNGKPINDENLFELRLFCREHDIPLYKPINFRAASQKPCPCAYSCMCDTDDPTECCCYPECICGDISDDGDGPDTDASQPNRSSDDCGCAKECIGRCSTNGYQLSRADKLTEFLTAGRLLQEAEERFRKARLAFKHD